MGKRILDLSVGTLLLALTAPIVAVGAIVVMISLRTVSPFFFQTRIGRGGAEIRFPKLRTMPKSMPEYALKTTVSFDQLPTPMKFLRRVHIDELPQLLLVVTGTISLVGPRPKMPDVFEPVSEPYGTARVQVAQGCTGLWQISAHKHELPSNHPEYDLFYVENQSLPLDLWILWRTIAHGLRLTRPITLADVPAWISARQWQNVAVVGKFPTASTPSIDPGDPPLQ